MNPNVVRFEQVIATHRHEWNKWPDTEDRDYSDIRAKRDEWYFHSDDGSTSIVVTNRYYPVYSAYVDAGIADSANIPQGFPHINNTLLPHKSVIDAQKAALEAISKSGVRSILWEHCHQCFPSVAENLPSWFPALRIIHFFDDCPGSSEIKTFPVCGWFNALFYGMYVWNAKTGAKTHDEYARRGLGYHMLCPPGLSGGFSAGLESVEWSVERKLDRASRGELPIDLVFCGYAGSGDRGHFLRTLNRRHYNVMVQKGVRTRLHGVDMADGPLEPRWPPHPMGMGFPVGVLAADALAGINLPVSSIFNCRLLDLWLSATVQIVYDPWNELPSQGFSPGEHYLPLNIDGDRPIEALYEQIDALKKNPAEAVRIARAAYEKASEWFGKMNWTSRMGRIYFDHLNSL